MAGFLSLISNSLKNRLTERRKSVLLWKFKPDGSRDSASGFRFQYFPETLSDTKAINYSSREILGANLPIYQWVSGGERLITFTAIFASDLDMEPGAGQDVALHRSNLEDLKSKGQALRTVSIRGAIAYLRSCMTPKYEPGVVIAPPILELTILGSGIGVSAGHALTSDPSMNTIRCQMTQCDVEYRAFFPESGLPRVASVALAFAQVAQSENLIEFPGMDEAVEEEISTYLLSPDDD